MDDEKLIALVEVRPELYSKSNPYYKFQLRKDRIWEDIGRDMNSTGKLCRRRWLALRDRYGSETRKAIAPSGSGAQFYKQ